MVLLHLDAFVGQNLTFSHQISVQLKTSEHFRAHFFVFRAQFLTKRRHFRPDPFLSCAERWQDLRAVRDSRARAAKGAPSWQDLRAVYPPTAICGAFRMHGAHILPKPARFRMHGARILPRTGDFPARGHFRDAWSAKLATDCRPGTHRGGILPRQDPRERIAREYCHCQSGQGRIRAQSRHRRTLGNAFRERFAIVERLGTHQGIILPRPDARAERPVRPCATASAWPTAVAPSAPPFAYVTRHPDAAELRVLQAVRALAVAQPADCRVAAERVVNIAKLVSVPQRRSARHHAPRCHAPQRHNAMRCNIA